MVGTVAHPLRCCVMTHEDAEHEDFAPQTRINDLSQHKHCFGPLIVTEYP